MASELLTPYDHQVKGAAEVAEHLRKHLMTYVAWEERTGKTVTAILAVEQLNVQDVLVVTKKKAIPGWQEPLSKLQLTKDWRVSSYHSAHKERKPQLIVLDEAHNYISGYPKPGAIWKQLKQLCQGVPILYLSATPHAQGYSMLYHQFALSSWSPWAKYRSFYQWFKVYGLPYTIEINGIEVNQYNRTNSELVLADCQHLFLTKTRAELDFEFEPEDKVHWIAPSPELKHVYNTLVDDRVLQLKAGWLVADTKSKLRVALHQLEGGTIKIDDVPHVLANCEKVEYILKHWGDADDLVIMYNFQAEATKLASVFKRALLLQATSNAEGVDLHKYKHLVLYSQDYSTARHTQRRARQANKQRAEPIIVHHLLMKGAISQQVYRTVVQNKKNFVDSVFEVESL